MMRVSFPAVWCCLMPATILLVSVGCGGDSSSSSGSSQDAAVPSTRSALGTSSTDGSIPAAGSSQSASTGSSSGLEAAGWGDLRGRFVVDGPAEQAARLIITKDQEFCGTHDLRNETLMVNADNGGLGNVVVYLYVRRGTKAPQTHPSYAATANTKVLLDNHNCRFEPHVCVLTTSQTLVVGNQDPVGHNTKIDTISNPAINENLPARGTIQRQYSSEERRPATVSCSIHPWMRGYLLVRQSPYFAVTDKNGDFEIKNLPAGEWTFQVWHEAGELSEVIIGGTKAKWSRGRAQFTIKPDGVTDLSDIKVSASTFGG